MTQQIIDTGLVANDGTGESLRNAFTAVNNNFANVWAAGPVDTQVIINSNVVSTNVTNLDLRLASIDIGSKISTKAGNNSCKLTTIAKEIRSCDISRNCQCRYNIS